MAAAKEFNVGKDTLVDFLLARGFSKDDLKPTSKLSEEMYRSLQQEFQGDKVAKLKSDQIDLPKGAVEARKRKEDEAMCSEKIPQDCRKSQEKKARSEVETKSQKFRPLPAPVEHTEHAPLHQLRTLNTATGSLKPPKVEKPRNLTMLK